MRILFALVAMFVGLRAEAALTPAQREALIIIQHAERNDAHDGNRWRVEGETLFFEGEITRGECARFRGAVGSARRLVVNSGGGDAVEGLCIGQALYELHFESVTVDGMCVSACANYLFTAAPRKIIKRGFVGFHGNITAYLKTSPGDEIRSQFKGSDLPASEIEAKIGKFLATLREASVREHEFFASLGISQDLFDRTQRLDKGIPGGEYEFLLPKPETFLRYGVTGVEGTQDFALSETMGSPDVLD